MHVVDLCISYATGQTHYTRNRQKVWLFTSFEMLFKKNHQMAVYITGGHTNARRDAYKTVNDEQVIQLRTPGETRVAGCILLFGDNLRARFAIDKMKGNIHFQVAENKDLFNSNSEWVDVAQCYAVMKPACDLALLVQTDRVGAIAESWLYTLFARYHYSSLQATFKVIEVSWLSSHSEYYKLRG